MTFDVAVMGAGVFGAWTAWHLQRTGRSVALVDPYGAGNSRSSSGGESRILRMGYGPDEIYTRSAMRSLELWREVCPAVFHRTGVLWVFRQTEAYAEATRETLRRCGVPFEDLSEQQLLDRHPQLCLDPGVAGVFETASGVLMARRAVQAVVQDFITRGGVYVNDSGGVSAETFVYACGPWLPKLFPDLLADRIWPTRQEVFFFGASPELPVWIDFSYEGIPYGLPDLDGRGFKIAFDRHGPPFDPDTGERLVSLAGLMEVRKFLARRLPELKNAPLVETRVCQYENTSSGDFLIDRHPERPTVWLVGGGSGHGFKHGPALGEYVTRMILGCGQPEPRFSLAAKDTNPNRTVF